MGLAEFISCLALALVLLGLAVYFALRQKRSLRLLSAPEVGPEDRQFIHRQVRRRLLCSVLMVALAGMLIGWLFLESQVRPLPDGQQPLQEELRAERTQSLRVITVYWIVALLLVFAILFLAAIDLLATARFGLRHHRQLEAERREVLEREASRLRQERNGHT